MTLLGRFEDLGPLGAGGMGEVRRVRDPVLDRVLALKVLPLGRSGDLERRFVAEARICASLEHPAIVPVHELGWLPDGRAWFTMREVRGRTLGEVLGDRPPLRRTLEQLARVAEAVAFAHSRGVVHRDLKPTNVMIGDYGEVFVVDWGIAKVVGGASGPTGAARGADPALTVDGSVLGTPVYMAPEQAFGDPDAIGPATDVWGLGAVLYEVLTGRPPLQGQDTYEVVARLSDPRLVVRRVSTPVPVDHALWEVCERCLRREPADRFAHAGLVADALRGWLEGERSRERALGDVAAAEAHWGRADGGRAGADALRRQAADALGALPHHAPERERWPAWDLEDRAAAALTDAALADVAAEQAVGAALAAVPLLPEAHALLARRQRAALAAAEAGRDDAALARAAALLDRHVRALPDDHPDRAGHLAWLAGTSRLQVHAPPGTVLALERAVEERRRLGWREEGTGAGAVDRELPAGSWRVSAGEQRYPVLLERGGQRRLDVVTGPPPPAGAVFVPPGPFVAGGHHRRERRTLWCAGFVIGRFPVTMGEYVRFLDDLVAQGRTADALRHAPQVPLGRHGDGPLLLERGADGRFRFGRDADGDEITPDLPAFCVDWTGAVAYAAWLRQQTGLPWRLPGELEWEKAARGVDGRSCPWGEQPDPSRANTRDSATRAGPCPVDSFPVDESPFGMRGAAGNVRDWTADAWCETWSPLDGDRVVPPPLDPPPVGRVIGRGGAWPLAAGACTALVRVEDRPEYRHPGVGFRVCCSWP